MTDKNSNDGLGWLKLNQLYTIQNIQFQQVQIQVSPLDTKTLDNWIRSLWNWEPLPKYEFCETEDFPRPEASLSLLAHRYFRNRGIVDRTTLRKELGLE